MLSWAWRARLRVEVTKRIWPIPLGFAVVAVGLAQLVPWIDSELARESTISFDTSSAQATLSAIASGMLVFIGFVFSVVTFAIQYEASTYTPRLLRTIANSTAMRITLGVFIATFLYALLVLAEIQPGSEYKYSVVLAVVLVGVSVLFFLGLMTGVADRARSGRTIGAVARSGRRTIERICRPALDTATRSGAPSGDDLRFNGAGRVVGSTPEQGGVVQAVDVGGIVELAREHDVVVELVPEVGAFVAAAAPLFRVHGESARFPDQALRDSILLGEERTADQDPQLAFRILADIAIRALSPAVNDPTTAVEAVDRIGDLLLMLAGRGLPDGLHRDRAGAVRLVEPVPTWDDYLELALTEVRLYGADSPFVARRMRRILQDLRSSAPLERRRSVDRQLDLLERAAPHDTKEEPDDLPPGNLPTG